MVFRRLCRFLLVIEGQGLVSIYVATHSLVFLTSDVALLATQKGA